MQLTGHSTILPDMALLSSLLLKRLQPHVLPKRLWLSEQGDASDSHRHVPRTSGNRISSLRCHKSPGANRRRAISSLRGKSADDSDPPVTDTDLPTDDPQFEPPLHESGNSSGTGVPLSTPATSLQLAERATWVSSSASGPCTNHCKPDRQNLFCEPHHLPAYRADLAIITAISVMSFTALVGSSALPDTAMQVSKTLLWSKPFACVQLLRLLQQHSFLGLKHLLCGLDWVQKDSPAVTR